MNNTIVRVWRMNDNRCFFKIYRLLLLNTSEFSLRLIRILFHICQHVIIIGLLFVITYQLTNLLKQILPLLILQVFFVFIKFTQRISQTFLSCWTSNFFHVSTHLILKLSEMAFQVFVYFTHFQIHFFIITMTTTC